MSDTNLDNPEDGPDSPRPPVEAIHYEWESELEEYDEPDCYPCEKDYQMVDVQITDSEASDEEGEKEPQPRESLAQIAEDDVVEVQKQESATQAEQAGEEEKKEEEGGKKEEEKKEGEEEEEEKKEGEEEDDDVFVPDEEKDEDEEKVVKKKRYKTVRVRKLIERGPKIYYEPDLERVNAMSSEAEFFSDRPFKMVHSFGYDCQRMANLHLLDENTLVFMSGFVLTFFDLNTKEKSYHRCLGGSCYGALCIHPSKKLFAAAEKGEFPIVGIWSWPKLQLFRKLCGGAEAVYASVNFSPDGKLLASQGAEPDFLITVWNWLAEMPVLRVKSHAQDVYRVTFSSELAGNLTTSGLCHIKFWKMASTFTGLKLKGDIGRFGKTELSDIEAYAELADGKVVSGSEWGNLLVWENGLIVAEICADGDIPCHKGIVRQVFMHDGDFVTTGQDGYVRVWNHDAIDTSEVNTTEHSNKVPLKTMAEVCIDENADIWYLINEFPDLEGNLSAMWYAQDGKGVVWSVDLSFLHTAKDPQKVLTSHGGAIAECQVSSFAPLLASVCRSGEVRVNCYTTNDLVASRSFTCAGSCLLWPTQPEHRNVIAVGFEDGSLRILSLSRHEDTEKGLPMSILLERVCKPHSRIVTSLAMDANGDMLATGSLDGTIFFFDARNQFLPMVFTGAIDYKSVLIVRFSRQSTLDDDDPTKKVVAAIEGGMLMECTAPDFNGVNNSVTYFDSRIKITRIYEFRSVKSQILHDEQIEREREEAEMRQRETDEKNRKLIEDGEETQEEQNYRLLLEADEIELETKKLMEERKKWRPYIPAEPSPILFMMQSPFNTSDWILSMGKYDAGFLYVVQLKTESELNEGGTKIKEPITSVALEDYNEMGVNTMCMSGDGSKLYMGFEDGRIRVQHLYSSFEIDTLGPYWSEGIHDIIRGNISTLVIAQRAKLLFSTGHDGNLFMFSLPGAPPDPEQLNLEDFPDNIQRKDIRDNVDWTTPTLEIFKNQEKELALLAEAKKNKALKKEKIQLLRHSFNELMKRNKELPEHERLTPIEFTITSDNADRKKQEFEAAKNLLEKTMAWECCKCSIALNKLKSYYRDVCHCEMFVLKAFQSDLVVSSYRISKLPPFFEAAKERAIYDATPPMEGDETSDGDSDADSDFDAGFTSKPKYNSSTMDKWIYQGKVRRWRKRQKRAHRRTEWHEFLKTEPTDKDLRREELQIAYATENMGDMKLKTADNYKVPEHKRPTANRIRKALIRLEETMFHLQDKFNKEMKLLRQYKITHFNNMKKFEKNLLVAVNDLPIYERLDTPSIPEIGPDEDPDAIFKYTKQDIQTFKESTKSNVLTKASATKQQKTEAKPTKRMKRKSTFHPDKLGAEKKEIDRDVGSYVEKEFAPPSMLEEQIEETKIVKARFNQNYYNSLILKEMASFDAKLKLLRHRKIYLDIVLKQADARMVLLTQEFILVSKSEQLTKQSNGVITRTNKERKDCLAEMKICNKKMEAVKKVLEGYTKQRLALQAEVVAIAKENCPHYEKYLVRVFKKKFAKPKEKRDNYDGSDSESEEDSSSDDDFDLSEEDEDDDGLDVDLPPTDLATGVYDAVIAVRERRREVDHEEEDTLANHDEINAAINTFKSRIAAAEKENDAATKKVEAIIKAQSHQQNDIDFAVSVKKHQIYHMDKKLDQTLLTNESDIHRLKNRIPELVKEKMLEKKKVFDTRKEFAHLGYSKQMFLDRLQEKDDECDDEMTKKFGTVADVEFLENFEIDPEIQELNRRLQDEKDKTELMENLMEDKLNEMRMVNTEAVKKHNARLFAKAHMLSELTDMQHSMEAYLKAFPSGLEDTGYTKEIRELKHMVVTQWRAIHYLNLEIHKLSVKPNPPLPPIRPRSR